MPTRPDARRKADARGRFATYRVVLAPLKVHAHGAKRALDMARVCRDAVNQVLPRLGYGPTGQPRARVQRLGPRGGWRRTREPDPR